MSDLLIKGMEMPKQCWNSIERCPFHTLDYHGKSHCELSDDIRCLRTKRPKECPLVELTPHGRLIDAWELECEFISHDSEYSREQAFDAVKNAPTVLEASNGNSN